MAELAVRPPSAPRSGSSLLADDLVDSGPGAISPFSEGLDGHSTTVELAPTSARLPRVSSRRLVRPRRRRPTGAPGATAIAAALLAAAVLAAALAALVLERIGRDSDGPPAAQAPR